MARTHYGGNDSPKGGLKSREALLAGIRRYFGTLNSKRTPFERLVSPNDWHLRRAAAQAQGEFWYRTLIGR